MSPGLLLDDSTRSSDSATPPFPQLGSVAPDFALPRLASQAPYVSPDSVRLSDFAGQWVYLDVFGSWCPPCRLKYPRMSEIAGELERAGAVVLGLLLEDKPRAAAEYFREVGGQAYPFLVLDDETTRAWGLTGAPMGILVSPDGHVRRYCFGCSRGEASIETLVDAIEGG